MLCGEGKIVARVSDAAEEGVDGWIVGGGFRGFLEMLFGSGEIFLHEFVHGKILQGGKEVRVDLESGFELAVGGGEITFCGEGDAEEVQRFEIARIGVEKRLEDGDAFVELAVANERLRLIVRRNLLRQRARRSGKEPKGQAEKYRLKLEFWHRFSVFIGRVAGPFPCYHRWARNR